MKVGFCCKWIDREDQIEGLGPNDYAKALTTRTTTIGWLNNQTLDGAHIKLWELFYHNMSAIKALVEKVAGLPVHHRMVRLSSDILPAYTHPAWTHFYKQKTFIAEASSKFAEIGQIARAAGVRLSFHPGQFCVLASENPDIVQSSIQEFEYHAQMAEWMGYTGWHPDGFKINVHIGGRLGWEGIITVLPKLSQTARNLITIENDEMSHGLDACLKLVDHLPIVLDVHHHWVATGEYIDPRDWRVSKVIDSWRGVRPALHYSVSSEKVLPDHPTDVAPDHATLISQGIKKGKLRAHSSWYWNKDTNYWISKFTEFDIQCESKAKNMAAFKLAADWNL